MSINDKLMFSNENYLQLYEIHAALTDVCLDPPSHRQASSFATSVIQQNRRMLKPEIERHLENL